MKKLLLPIAIFIRKIFYTFLDISGILLGVFLTLLGWWLFDGRPAPKPLAVIVAVIGVGAFIIHIGHYFSLRITRWLFGEDYFLRK